MAPGCSTLALSDPSFAKPLGLSLLRESCSHPPRFLSVSTTTVDITSRFRLGVSNGNWGTGRSIRDTGDSSLFPSKFHPVLVCMAARFPYDVLGLCEDASEFDIERAYRRKVGELTEAYEVLKRRQNHSVDQVIGGQHGPKVRYDLWKIFIAVRKLLRFIVAVGTVVRALARFFSRFKKW